MTKRGLLEATRCTRFKKYLAPVCQSSTDSAERKTNMNVPPGGMPQMDTESTVKQFKEFLSQYNKLTEMCFIDCAKDFTTRSVLKAENTCALNCLEKYLKMTQRISQRFQEYQLQHTDATTPVKSLTGS